MIKNGVILEIGSASGEKNGRQWTRFDAKFSDGKTYSTFDGQVNALSTKYQGQAVSIDYALETTSAGYTNLKLLRVGPEGSLGEVTENTEVVSTPQNISPSNGTGGTDRETAIRRSVALKLAVDIACNGGSDPIIEKDYARFDNLLKYGPIDKNDMAPEKEATTVPSEDDNNRNW